MVQKEFYINQKSMVVNIGGFDATQQKYLWAVPVRCFITNVRLISDVATTGSDGSNNYTFQIANLTASNNLLSAAIDTDDVEITANTPYALTPNQNSLVKPNDVLELQIVETGTGTDLGAAEVIVVIDYLPITNA